MIASLTIGAGGDAVGLPRPPGGDGLGGAGAGAQAVIASLGFGAGAQGRERLGPPGLGARQAQGISLRRGND